MHEKIMTVGRDMRVVRENIIKAEELAREILTLSRNSLLLNLRFLDRALVRFLPVDSGLTAEIATNGRYLYFNPTCILHRYKINGALIARDYLHVTLHCVFRHLFISRKVRPEIWDLACDLAVENIINELELPSLRCRRQTEQQELLTKLKEEVRPLTAEKLYKYFSAQEVEPGDFAHLRVNFYSDDHALWYEENKAQQPEKIRQEADQEDSAAENGEKQLAGQGNSKTQPPEEDEDDENASPAGQAAEAEADQGSGEGSSGQTDDRPGREPNLTRAELEKIWQEISQRIQVDLDTHPSSWGQSEGGMQQALRAVNQEKTDYTEFLRHFAVLGENMEVNDEEFDLSYYTYGLARYGNLPLIEPLESKETKRIREFVIAIDTSESVEKELVHKFVTKTYNILKQSDSFFQKTNIHILQCGASVTEDVKLTSPEDFEAYLRQMTLKGFGGTDFRPVFEHVDQLIEAGEFVNFKGLIYFTDGFGTFPFNPPKYDVAFIFVEDDSLEEAAAKKAKVPVWAARVRLRKDDLELF
jgi:predicted metal-dependent peptidase